MGMYVFQAQLFEFKILQKEDSEYMEALGEQDQNLEIGKYLNQGYEKTKSQEEKSASALELASIITAFVFGIT